MWYFAYGSNMESGTLRGRRGIPFRRAVAARAPGWRVVFDKPPRPRSARGSRTSSWVRNPIYSSMLAATVGLALVVPNVLSALALIALVVGLELHVRWVEEPYLARTTDRPTAHTPRAPAASSRGAAGCEGGRQPASRARSKAARSRASKGGLGGVSSSRSSR
jgi:hypothetical protein